MTDRARTKAEIIDELKALRARVAELERAQAVCKRAVEALRESRKELSQAIHGNSIATFVIGKNHAITHWNEACQSLTGLSAGEMVGTGKPWAAFYSVKRPVMADLIVDGAREQDVAAHYGDKCRKSALIEGAYEAESLFPSLGDGGKWLFLTAAPLRDRRGEVTGAVETLQDITERKRLEERTEHLCLVLSGIRKVNQLIIREKDRDRLVQGACDNLIETRGYHNAWVALTDDSGKVLTTADAGLGEAFAPMRERLKRGELTDCGRKALTQSGCVVVEDPASACGDCPLAAMYAGRAALAVRLEHAGKVHGLLTVSLPRQLVVEEQEVDLFHEVAGDIAFALHSIELEENHKRAERELEALFRLHETTVEAMPLSLLVLDEDLNVVIANRKYLDTRGAKASEVFGKNIEDVFPRALLREQSLLERVRAVAEHGGQEELRNVFHTAGGHPDKYLNIRICGVGSPRGKEKGARVVLIIEDVTRQKALEEQLRGAARMEAVGRLAGGVAHDFNNILTGISGYTDFVLEEVPEGSSARNDLTQVSKLAKRAEKLTRQLLAFSRRQPLEMVVLNTNGLVEDATKMLARLIGEDIALVFEPGQDLGNVRADPVQIEQILLNLAVNARDAMPEGGKLTIETANVDLDRAYASGHIAVKPGPYVMLAVSDTGCGIDEETQQRIFDPFFTTKKVGEGTGLGLATVYGIVKQHRGNIWVYSEPGQGTTFKIYLPRVREGAEAKEDAKSEDTKGTETILIVEDDPLVRAITERDLKAHGYQVLSAASPDEAEDLVAESEYRGEVAILLTDVVMPGRNGRELYHTLKADRPCLKVLYMSGYTDNVVVHHGVLEPGTAFIQKPFTPHVLARKVRETLDA